MTPLTREELRQWADTAYWGDQQHMEQDRLTCKVHRAAAEYLDAALKGLEPSKQESWGQHCIAAANGDSHNTAPPNGTKALVRGGISYKDSGTTIADRHVGPTECTWRDGVGYVGPNGRVYVPSEVKFIGTLHPSQDGAGDKAEEELFQRILAVLGKEFPAEYSRNITIADCLASALTPDTDPQKEWNRRMSARITHQHNIDLSEEG